jgi:predicted dehydrogenase
MARLAAAVIGTGSMGRNHARVYAELEEVLLVALADPCQDSVKPLAQQYNATAYADYREMLRREKPDIVSVVTPNTVHKEVALAAIDSGAHLLVEKPLASHPQDGWAILKAAERRSVKLTVGHTERFNPAIQELRKRNERGELGHIFQIHARRMGPFPKRIRDAGVVIDLATHDLDIMLYLVGSDVSTIYAETMCGIHTRYEDSLFGLLRLRDGILGILDINWITPTTIRELIVTGEKGMFIADYLAQDLFFAGHPDGSENAGATPASSNGHRCRNGMVRLACKKEETLKAELRNFVQCVLADRPPLVQPQEALLALDLAHKLIQAGREGRVLQRQEALSLAER